jgi:hypothetical protein
MKTENKVLEPTMNFRWLRFGQFEQYGEYCMKLQQAWKDGEGVLEWRDIPIEMVHENIERPTLANIKYPTNSKQ